MAAVIRMGPDGNNVEDDSDMKHEACYLNIC